jgi:hypothetical protein
MEYEEKYKKEILEDLIFNKKIAYEEIGRMYGVSGTYIKKVSKRFGIKLPVRAKFNEDFKPYNAGTAKRIKCLNCEKEVITSYDSQKYCSIDCSAKFRMIDKYADYLNNQDQYCGVYKDMKFIKKHILNEQNGVCIICSNINIWNNKPLVLILDHIDGNAYNNCRENLRLICPNCDSQLDTYKSKNKNSARKERYLKNYKNNMES